VQNASMRCRGIRGRPAIKTISSACRIRFGEPSRL
jgi:hypothetical protein